MTANISAVVKMAIFRNGITNWRKIQPEVRHQLIADEFKILRREIDAKYGSGANYLRIWLKRKGIRKIEYENQLAIERGFNGLSEYQDSLYQKRGFEGKADNARFKRLRRHYHKSISDFDVREIQLKREGFADWEEKLKKFILIRRKMRSEKMKTQEARYVATRLEENATAQATPQACVEGNPMGMMKEFDYPSKGKEFLNAQQTGQMIFVPNKI
ncbi:MAG: hypothetical protein HY376_03235 [Candidatus Blackburnbacteria bacterium]|nr:hypothetical protein [Candidatus Blackburnbacteria bacterium]